MRPASHMPLEERMTFGVLSVLSAMESSFVTAVCRLSLIHICAVYSCSTRTRTEMDDVVSDVYKRQV